MNRIFYETNYNFIPPTSKSGHLFSYLSESDEVFMYIFNQQLANVYNLFSSICMFIYWFCSFLFFLVNRHDFDCAKWSANLIELKPSKCINRGCAHPKKRRTHRWNIAQPHFNIVKSWLLRISIMTFNLFKFRLFYYVRFWQLSALRDEINYQFQYPETYSSSSKWNSKLFQLSLNIL